MGPVCHTPQNVYVQGKELFLFAEQKEHVTNVFYR